MICRWFLILEPKKITYVRLLGFIFNKFMLKLLALVSYYYYCCNVSPPAMEQNAGRGGTDIGASQLEFFGQATCEAPID